MRSQLCASVEYARQLKHTHTARAGARSNASARVALLPGDSYVVKKNVNVTFVTVAALAHPSKWHECPPRQISRPQGHE